MQRVFTSHAKNLLCAVGVATAALLSASCAAPEQPQPQPQPQPQTPQTSRETATESAATAARTATKPTTAPVPSEDAAEVEVTEYPVGQAPKETETKNASGSRAPAQQGQRSPTAQSEPAAAQNTARNNPQTPSSSAGERALTQGANAGATQRSSGATPPVGSGTQVPQRPVTDDEKIGGLNKTLDAKLAEFDRLMREAEAQAAAERTRQQERGGSTAGAPDGYGGRSSMDERERGAGGAAQTTSGAGHTPDLSGSGHTSGAPRPPGAPNTVAMPDGHDDDIVARQLREAAMRETDPVLREKLWAEYRKYKGGR